jgi:hypothetical protein
MQHVLNNCFKAFWFLSVFIVVFLHAAVGLLNFVTETQEQQGNITYTTTTLSEARYGLTATSSGELVLFGGGLNSTGASDRVDIYNVTSGSWTTATLSVPRHQLAATSSQNLVFFGGGGKEAKTPTTVYDRVDIYNTSNGSWSTATLSQPRYGLAATSVGNLVLFGGGYNSTGYSNVVDVFDVTSNTWTNATLSEARRWLASTSVDNRYALFAGGQKPKGSNKNQPSNVVDIFDSLNGMWNTTTLSQARSHLAATSLGNLAFFGGGHFTKGSNENQPSNVVDIFNSTSQTWSTSTLSQARDQLASSSIGEIVAFGGGWNGSSASSVVDVLNVTSGIWFTVTLSVALFCLASTSSKNKIFFGGGNSTNGYSNVVNIFEIPSSQISIPTFNPLSFPISSTSLLNTSTNSISKVPFFTSFEMISSTQTQNSTSKLFCEIELS